jgi:hypothetical protein
MQRFREDIWNCWGICFQFQPHNAGTGIRPLSLF